MNLLGYSVAAVLVALAAFFIVRKLRRPAANVAPLAPSPVDQNVQFTVYRPKAVAPNRWQTMLAFAHLSERRPDEPEQPDPIEEMERQAKTVLAAQTANYDQRTQDSGSAVPRGGWITFVPKISGVEFNPPKRTFQWTESVHREEFRLRASGDLVGRTLRGSMRVYLGALMLAEINLTLPVEVGASKAKPTTPQSAAPFRKIFASYSHNDVDVVEQYESYLALLGDRVLRDWKDLRAGEVWDDRLMQMIRDADVFQLFWSSNSMRSESVRREYEYAISLGRERFICPTYWESPMPQAEGLPPAELERLHFQRLDFGPPPATRKPRKVLVGSGVAALLAFICVGTLMLGRDAQSEFGSVDSRIKATAENHKLEDLVRANEQVEKGSSLLNSTGDKVANITAAIAAFDSALAVYKKKSFPSEWASIQVKLAAAYAGLAEASTDRRAENLQKAIAAYRAAASVRNNSDPEIQDALSNLGNMYQKPVPKPLPEHSAPELNQR